MTISTTTSRVSFAGNASTVNFATGFKFFAATDLTVIIVTDSTGAEVTKTLTTHYSVAGAGSDSGGTVTMGAAPASGQTIVIVRTQPYTQGLDLVENDPFPSDSVEETLDKIVVMTQQNDDALLRSVRKAEGFTETFDPTLPKIITGSTVLAFNAGATAFEIGPTTTAISGAAASATAAATSATASASSATASANSATASANSATASAGSATAAAASAASIGLTTRGDLLKRGASANERLAIGSANTVLTTNGTDPAWSTITNAMLAGSIDLTNKVTGALPIANGGTAATSAGAARTALGLAIGSDVQAFSSNIVQKNVQNTFTKAQVPSTYTAALSATSGVLDYDTYTNFIVTLAAGSNTLAAPTTEGSQVGQCGVIIFVQPASGSAATVSLHADYETAAAAGLVVSSANNDYDVVPYMIKADNSVLLGAAQLNFG